MADFPIPESQLPQQVEDQGDPPGIAECLIDGQSLFQQHAGAGGIHGCGEDERVPGEPLGQQGARNLAHPLKQCGVYRRAIDGQGKPIAKLPPPKP